VSGEIGNEKAREMLAKMVGAEGIEPSTSPV